MNEARYILPLLLLAFFAQAKLELNPQSRYERMSDGLFYYQIAEHVADGDGLLTSVSLYGQGLREMPSPTTVQPLWPLVMGLSARWIGLDRAAESLPELLYFVVLVLLYPLGNRVGRSLGGEILLAPRGIPLLDLGTLAVAILGSNSAFSAYTSKAYTEGLAFALLTASLLALPSPGGRRLVLRGALAGALAGLAYLTRSQLVGAPFAVAGALIFVGLGVRPLRRAAVASLLASVAVVLPWIVFLIYSLGSFSPRVLISFSAYRETAELAPVALVRSFPGATERLLDLAGSLVHAFNPLDRFSYFTSFGLIIYAVPVFAFALAYRLVRGSASLLGDTGDQRLLPLACLLIALVALLPLHVAHMALGPEWLFYWRHGLPLIFCIVPAVAWLGRSSARSRRALVAVAAVGVFFPMLAPTSYLKSDVPTWSAEIDFMRWLDAHPKPPVVHSMVSRSIAAQSNAVAHSINCTSADLLIQQIEALPADYLVEYPWIFHCKALKELPAERFRVVKRFGMGNGQITVRQPLPADRQTPR